MTMDSVQQTGDLKERLVDLPGGVRVRLVDEGAGPPVLLLHGNPDNADEWKALITLLKDEFRCLAPDLPGYGRRGQSFALPQTYRYSLEDQVAFIDALLAHEGIQEKLTLVVHDIGGIMGIPWAASNTNRLHAVLYTNTVAYPRFKWFPLAYRWGREGWAGRGLARLSMAVLGRFGGWLFRGVFSKQHPRLSPSELDRFVRAFALNPVAKATSLCEFRRITRPEFFDGYDQMLKTIAEAVPTLTIWGEGDPYVPDRFAQALFAHETTVLPAVGHWVPILAADVLAEHIRSMHGLAPTRMDQAAFPSARGRRGNSRQAARAPDPGEVRKQEEK
jgi:pimeloyl-ACP methyl ester carboxylesterase